MGMFPYSGELNRKARELANAAKRKEVAGDLKGASVDLDKAAQILTDLSENSLALDDQIRLSQKARRYKDVAKKLASGERVSSAPLHESGTLPAEDEYRASVDELVHRSNVTWDDIGGMHDVKTTLKYTLGTMLARHPENVTVEIGRRLLMYGPPGTGKTLLAAASSNMLGATFFNVKASDLMSKYFGESTKLISALFKRAREEAAGGAALVFIDEVDSLSMSRDEASSSGAEQRIVSTLLAELDGMADKGATGGVITIAATNKPWSIDEAIRQRFEKNVYVSLPDHEARKAIFEVHLKNRGILLEEKVSYDWLASNTENYSGRLIRNVCQEAVEGMLRQMNIDVPDHVDRRTIGEYTLKLRPLQVQEFKNAFGRVRPTTTEDTLKSYKEWSVHVGGQKA